MYLHIATLPCIGELVGQDESSKVADFEIPLPLVEEFGAELPLIGKYLVQFIGYGKGW
jgi:hypothetical protein